MIDLLFGVHAHQPVGNFASVIDDAHVRCYGMFLRVLDRYPEFRFNVHFSGWLLDQLHERHPADMALLAGMTARGQVEWFGSGDCEPVLAAIPQRDRISQLDTLSGKIARHYGRRPQGAWLTERVWESSVITALAATGIRYAVVDDYNFLCTGLPAAALDGYYSTEEGGQRLDLYPISETLRYRLPFSPAGEAVAHLETLAQQGRQAAIYFDDIEKFGIWPETYAWVYEQRWLEQFIEGVLASPHIRTSTFADHHAQAATRGIVYLPTASYFEMNEWTLPPHAAASFNELVDAEKRAGRYERHKPFLRGGIWRNFISRYPESNWMHKRMLAVSTRLADVPADAPQRAVLQEHLHRAQANDAYWHGLFGGLYLPHLRRAVWNNLLALEAALDHLRPRPAGEQTDLDLDGHAEPRLTNAELQAIARADGDACLIEFDSYPLRHNFADTLRRHAEGYHRRIEEYFRQHTDGGNGSDGATDTAPRSAHDRIAFKHPLTAEDARPDIRPRGICVDSLIDGHGAAHALQNYRLVAATAGELHFTAEHAGTCSTRIDKHYRLAEHLLTVEYVLTRAAQAVEDTACALEIRLDLAMPSCDGYSGRYRLQDGSTPCGFGETLQLGEMDELTLEDDELGGALRLTADYPLQLDARPHHTVSQSEAGFEKIMQSVCLTLRWQPPPTGQQKLWLALSVSGSGTVPNDAR
ncbi:alpha-amylase/4-alpha-glucanotransferase domain-containing protein [Sterolibacterium denitrificans]|nr:alpha-amylase/4-alpha-glucanotransferase domain-containing protein [Sterolibacterium denitrificans]